jgi:hypothetical protein
MNQDEKAKVSLMSDKLQFVVVELERGRAVGGLLRDSATN